MGGEGRVLATGRWGGLPSDPSVGSFCASVSVASIRRATWVIGSRSGPAAHSRHWSRSSAEGGSSSSGSSAGRDGGSVAARGAAGVFEEFFSLLLEEFLLGAYVFVAPTSGM